MNEAAPLVDLRGKLNGILHERGSAVPNAIPLLLVQFHESEFGGPVDGDAAVTRH